MNPLISVIIPVYNVEKYLPQCLDSVINQTLKDIEIICVDDGSTDNSINILNEYAAKDKRIIIITQKNLHAGIARNNGLKIARANYIIFLDSDDFFKQDMLENMYKSAIKHGSDITICGFYKYDNKTNKIIKKMPNDEELVKKSPFNPNNLKNKALNFTNPAPWNKLFSKEFFIRNNLSFDNYISCNDLSCITLAVALAKKVTVLQECYVYYRMNHNSLTKNRGNHFESALAAIAKIENELKKLNLFDKLESAFISKARGCFRYESSFCEDKKDCLKKAKYILSNELYNILTKPKVSIIVPIYNTEKYLEECLNSIINQTIKEIEIICINDGSTDRSLEILNKYAIKDNRIKVITQQNSGVSNARNKALDNCNGEYVCFVDSDDYIEKDFCEKLLAKFNKEVDLVCAGHIKLNNLNKKISPWLPSKDISNNGMKDILYFTKHRNASQKMFKFSIIKNNNIKFSEDLHYMEDALFLVSYLYYCRCIASVEKPLYVVRINLNSLCRSLEFKERREKEKEIAQERINSIIKKYDEKRGLA